MAVVSVKSPLTMEFLEKLHALPERREVKLLREAFHPQFFGIALAFKISVGALLIEVATQNPLEPFDIELRRADFRAWARASHLRSFFLNRDDLAVPDAQLRDWFFANFEEIYALLCEPVFADRLAKYRTFSRKLDEKAQGLQRSGSGN